MKQFTQTNKTKFTQVSAQFRSGPIPTPEELRQLNEVQSGLAERVVAMAEFEQKSRIENQKKILEIQEKLANKELSIPRRGQALGFASVGLIVGLCVLAFLTGHAEEAKYIACTVIVSLATTFLFVRKGAKKDPKENG